MPKAAAERKMAPMFVVSDTPLMTTMRCASRHIVPTSDSMGRRMAHSTYRDMLAPADDVCRVTRDVSLFAEQSHRFHAGVQCHTDDLRTLSYENALGRFPVHA